MKKFTKLSSTSLSIRTENIDTDQIIPARFSKTTEKTGLGKYLFYNWRYDANGKQNKNTDFNDLNYQSRKILVAGNNFGCGSSREHAVWALQDFGFKVLISSSFGDIFYSNALKNSLLPVVLKPQQLGELIDIVELKPVTVVSIDLQKQEVVIPSHSKVYQFPIDTFQKTCLLKGVDELGYILSHEDKIRTFESTHINFFHMDKK